MGGESLDDGLKWMGGVMDDNGIIYGIPYNNYRKILRYDTATNQTSFIEVNVEGGGGWWGGVLVRDSLIVCITYTYDRVMIIDTKNQTTKLVGERFKGHCKWTNGIVAGNEY